MNTDSVIAEHIRYVVEGFSTAPTPCDPETEPAAIRARHLAAVREALAAGVTDPAAIGARACVPLWNVERALHELRTSRRKPARRAKNTNRRSPLAGLRSA